MKHLKVSRIKNGTVIDHITPGYSIYVLEILNEPSNDNIVSLAMNVYGKKGKKDIVKIEDRYPDERETDMIALISPKATIDRIENYIVKEKYNVKLPHEVKGMVRCKDDNCIINKKYPIEGTSIFNKEPTEQWMIVNGKDKPFLKCGFCDGIIEFEEMPNYFIHRF